MRLKTTVSYQQTGAKTVVDSTKNNMEIVEPFVRQNQAENNYSIGIVLDHYYINYVDSMNHPNYKKFITTSDVSGTLGLARVYAQWQHAFNNQLTGYTGIHTQYFNLNQELSWEPRIALTWQPRGNNTFSLGYGLHSQIQPKSVYYYQTYDEFIDTYFQPMKTSDLQKVTMWFWDTITCLVITSG